MDARTQCVIQGYNPQIAHLQHLHKQRLEAFQMTLSKGISSYNTFAMSTVKSLIFSDGRDM